MGPKAILGIIAAMGLMAALPAEAQQTQSRLYEVTKSKKLRVCQFPLYYSISFRNPKTGEIVPITPRRVIVFKASNIMKDRINAALSKPAPAPAKKKGAAAKKTAPVKAPARKRAASS